MATAAKEVTVSAWAITKGSWKPSTTTSTTAAGATQALGQERRTPR
jgi:hypothetical protein